MGLYQAVAGAKITAAEWNTIYNLLKGVVGGEDPVRLAGNVAGTFMLQPNTDPASVVHLFPIKTQAGVEKFALRSDGIPVLAHQGGTPGSLENGMIWRNFSTFYGRLGDATVELFTLALPQFYLPATAFVASAGSPVIDSTHYHVCWFLDKAATEGTSGGWQVPRTGTVSLGLVQSNPLATTGNVRWQLYHKVVSPNSPFVSPTLVYQTAAVPSGNDNWNVVTMVTGLAVTAGQQLSVGVGRIGGDALDTADADVGFVGVNIEYTA